MRRRWAGPVVLFLLSILSLYAITDSGDLGMPQGLLADVLAGGLFIGLSVLIVAKYKAECKKLWHWLGLITGACLLAAIIVMLLEVAVGVGRIVLTAIFG